MTFRSTLSRLQSGVLVLILALMLAEIACRWLVPFLIANPKSSTQLAELRKQRLETLSERLDALSKPERGKLRGRRFHPYAGYTYWGAEMRQMRLLADQERRDDILRLVILGGSVAANFPRNRGSEFLAEALQREGVDNKLEIWNLARAGYRQPQQLFSVQTWLLLGLEPDIIVNLDGFNEVALAAGVATGNANPLYPYRDALAELSKRYRTQSLDPETIDSLYWYYRRSEMERTWLAWLQDNPLNRSALVGTSVELFRRRAERWDLKAQTALIEQAAGVIPDDFRGVIVDFGDPPYPRLARVWRESSEVLAKIAQHYGAAYVHLLQPNQYVTPGKPLSEEEYRTAWRPDGGWPQRAKQGYPFLKMEALKLKAAGMAVYDLTDLFAAERSTVYTDDCCHFNELGNRLLAERLAKILIAEGVVVPRSPAQKPESGARHISAQIRPKYRDLQLISSHGYAEDSEMTADLREPALMH